jgi:adenosylmethionine-8-amino-7-oxononanoate aminotransferase
LNKVKANCYEPLAATIIKNSLFDEFFVHDAMLFHGHTYTANPIACAVAATTLDLLSQQPDLYQKFEQRYIPFQNDVRDHFVRIRTIGCMWAGEWPYHLPYGCPQSLRLREMFLQKGVLARPLGSVLYFLPAYTISDDELRVCFEAARDISQQMRTLS